MGSVRAHRKLALVLGICGLVVVGAVVAALVVSSGDSSPSAVPTTGQYAPISVTRPKINTAGGAILNDPDAGVVSDLTTSVTQLPGVHRYRITVTNSSAVGFIDSFQWYPPSGVRIVKVTGSSVGHCGLTGLTGFGGNQFGSVLLYPNITCQKVDLKPPSCTCTGDGGSVDISFVADRVMGGTGFARLISARLVLKLIPSYLQAPAPAQPGVSGG